MKMKHLPAALLAASTVSSMFLPAHAESAFKPPVPAFFSEADRIPVSVVAAACTSGCPWQPTYVFVHQQVPLDYSAANVIATMSADTPPK